ncbi:hypothetical protein KCU86_g8694, partial [Aureobasidium melanogenum]
FFAPRAGVRYDGLYKVSGWRITQDPKTKEINYYISFDRLPSEPPLGPVLEHPTAEELDDYREYKRIRRDIRKNRNLLRHGLRFGASNTASTSTQDRMSIPKKTGSHDTAKTIEKQPSQRRGSSLSLRLPAPEPPSDRNVPTKSETKSENPFFASPTSDDNPFFSGGLDSQTGLGKINTLRPDMINYAPVLQAASAAGAAIDPFFANALEEQASKRAAAFRLNISPPTSPRSAKSMSLGLATTHALPSPDGHYIAGLTPDHLYVYYTATLTIASSFLLDNSNTPTTRSTETPTLHWTPCSLSIILQTSSYVSLYSLANTATRVKIANGSASLGRIASVDIFGENVFVVWEFGRIGIFEVARGRVTEVGELKTGIGSLKSAWGIRRVKGRAEVLAMMCRNSATDVLSLILAPSTTPFTTINIPTIDAQSLAWTPSGKWLSILDTPLSAPNSAVHIYTADGNFYRSYPPASSVPVEETYALGPLRQVWGSNHLALANADGSITLLSTTTFSPVYTFEPWTITEDNISAVYREQVSGKGERNWTYLGNGDDTTSQLLASYSPAIEMKFDAAGKFIAFRYEAFPETVVVWKIPSSKPIFASATQDTEPEIENNEDQNTSILVFHHHTTVKKLQWHPTISGLLLSHTEDNQVYLSSTTGETNAPLHLSHPFSAPAAASSTSSTPPTDLVNVHWVASSTILITTKKRGWVIAYPFGAPSAPSSPVQPKSSAELRKTGDEETQEEVSEDSLYDILSGRTPLPALRISDDYLPEDSEVEGDAEGGLDGLNDTFRGKGTAGTIGSFEY